MKFKSSTYWDKRYKQGGNSGSGSYGRLADFKAEVINHFIAKNNIPSVLEHGVGDGNQLTLYNIPKYVGLDVSKQAIKICKEKFKGDSTKQFFYTKSVFNKLNQKQWASDVGLSIDVIYHLIEDEVFHQYMSDLFHFADRFVVIYSSNHNSDDNAKHVKDRNFSEWIDDNLDDWVLDEMIENKYPSDKNQTDVDNYSRSNFYIYKKA